MGTFSETLCTVFRVQLSETLVILAVLQSASALVTQKHFLVYCEVVTEQEVKLNIFCRDKVP